MRDRKGKIEPWQANEPSKILARVQDTFWSRIFDNDIKFYVSPASEAEEDINKAKMTEVVLTWAIQVSKLKKKIWMSSRDALLTGEGYGRIKWTQKQEKVEYFSPTGKREYYMRDVRHPDYAYISPFNIFVDPVAPSFDEARYIIYRRILTQQQIEEEYQWLNPKLDWDLFRQEPQYGLQQDWLLSKIESFYYNSKTDIAVINDELSFDKSKQFEVIEYWTDDELSVFVN